MWGDGSFSVFVMVRLVEEVCGVVEIGEGIVAVGVGMVEVRATAIKLTEVSGISI